MVSYVYPPIGTMGGVRTQKFAKYLPDHGWVPTVLTVKRDRTFWAQGEPAEINGAECKVIRAAFPDIIQAAKRTMISMGIFPSWDPGEEEGLVESGDEPGYKRKIRRFLQGIRKGARQWIVFPDDYSLWFPFALFKGGLELLSGDYRALYSTSPPVTNHVVAAALQRLSGLPWVADFRDPWTQNDFLAEKLSPLRLSIERRFERFVLSRAGAIVAVTRPWADALRELHGQRPHGVRCIMSGFDPDDYEEKMTPTTDRFILTYAGMLYGFKRDPTVVVEAVEQLIDEGFVDPGDVGIRFYGPYEPKLTQLRNSLQHPEIVEIRGVISRSESIRRQQESTALLILQWNDPYTKGVYGGKIFEYLGAGRPIIAFTYKHGILGELMKKLGVGYASMDAGEIKAVMRRWFEEFAATGGLEFAGIEDEIKRLRWDHLSGELAAVLDDVSRAGRPLKGG